MKANTGWSMVVALMLFVGCGMIPAAASDKGGGMGLIETPFGVYSVGKRPYPPGTREQFIASGRALAAPPQAGLTTNRLHSIGFADNRMLLPPIGDQGYEGSCVHWAGTYACKGAAMKRTDPSLDLSDPANQPSPRFTYNLSNAGVDFGGFGHEPFEIFKRYGVPSLAQCPYTWGAYSHLPVAADFIEGLHRRSVAYVWLYQWEPTPEEIEALKLYLDAGGVAVCAAKVDQDSFYDWQAGDPPWVGEPYDYEALNHMMTVCGYGSNYYLVANSWSTNFGDHGYIRVDATYFETYFSDLFYTVEGSYEKPTHVAVIEAEHPVRSDLRQLQVLVNGAVVWDYPPTPAYEPDAPTQFTDDPRAGLTVAVDIGAGPWALVNTVEVRCVDSVLTNTGRFTHVVVQAGGVTASATNLPVEIPDNTLVPGVADVIYHTHPVPPPAWFIKYGITNNPYIEVFRDQDCDGATTAEEWVMDTDPTVAGDPLVVQDVFFSAQGGWTCGWMASTGRVYEVAVSTSLCAGVWTPLDGMTNLVPSASGKLVLSNMPWHSEGFLGVRVGVRVPE